MDEAYVSFPQRPPDDAVPSISKLYSTVHRRLTSIVNSSIAIAILADPLTDTPASKASISDENNPLSTPSRTSTPVSHAVHLSKSRAHVSDRDQGSSGFSYRIANGSNASDAAAFKSDVVSDSSALTSSRFLLNAAAKAAPSVQSETLTVLGDVDYLDTPTGSPLKSQPRRLSEGIDNIVPGFALQREVSSESESPVSPLHKRRPSISREESISTVLTRLKSGSLSKEFWMKDQNASACFRCEATFSSKLF